VRLKPLVAASSDFPCECSARHSQIKSTKDINALRATHSTDDKPALRLKTAAQSYAIEGEILSIRMAVFKRQRVYRHWLF